jgi:hypothetical protein
MEMPSIPAFLGSRYPVGQGLLYACPKAQSPLWSEAMLLASPEAFLCQGPEARSHPLHEF